MASQPQILLLGLKEPAATQCENALRKNQLPFGKISQRELSRSGWQGYPLVLCDAEVLLRLENAVKEKLYQYCPILMVFTSAPHLDIKSWLSRYPGPADLFFGTSYEWWIEQKVSFWWKHHKIWSARSTRDPLHFTRGEPMEGLLVEGDFAARLSHEIRTPLSAIKGALATLESGCIGTINSEQSEFIAMIDRNTQRLQKLVTEFLDMARLRAQKWTLRRAEAQIEHAAIEAVHSFTPAANIKNISLTLKCEENLPSLYIDSERILQVFQNLISNAIKYTTAAGTIVVEIEYPAKNQNDHICIWVRDTGIGIPQEHFTRIFQEFSQIDSIETRQSEGTGLGLAICKEIVEAHGGSIGVQSRVGEGSSFYFILPVHAGLEEKNGSFV